MIIIIGLGNPGKNFEDTRHNVGFMAIDEFAKKNNFLDFVLQKKANSFIAEKENILLAKPQTFMNESGRSVKELIKNRDFEILIVIHDDIDLPVGKIKIVKERGSAGHKGVESIIQNIGNKNLIRIRIGIAGQYDISAKDIVLKNFSDQERCVIDQTIEKAIKSIDCLIKNGIEKAMNEYN